MSFGSLSGTSFQSVFKTEIVLDARVKWGEMLRSRLSGNRVKGSHEWQVGGGVLSHRELSKEQELRSSLTAWKTKSVYRENTPSVQEMEFSARGTIR